MFVSGLKPEVFCEEIYSRVFETLVDVMAKTRHELVNYMDIIEISERLKRPEPKKDAKDSRAECPISRKQGFTSKPPSGASFVNETKVSDPAKTMDLKDVECFRCHKKGYYANKCPERASMVRAFSRRGSSRSLQTTKMMKKQSGRSGFDILTLIAAILTLSFDIGSSYTIWLGRFRTCHTLVTCAMCS